MLPHGIVLASPATTRPRGDNPRSAWRSQLCVLRIKTQVTARWQSRQGGNFSPRERAISTDWQVDDRQTPDIGHDSPVLPLMAETPKRDGLTREALPHTLAVTNAQGGNAFADGGGSSQLPHHR